MRSRSNSFLQPTLISQTVPPSISESFWSFPHTSHLLKENKDPPSMKLVPYSLKQKSVFSQCTILLHTNSHVNMLNYWGICQFNHFFSYALPQTLNCFLDDFEGAVTVRSARWIRWKAGSTSCCSWQRFPLRNKSDMTLKGKETANSYFNTLIKQKKISSVTVKWKSLQHQSTSFF